MTTAVKEMHPFEAATKVGREPYKVTNFDDVSYGNITLLKATASSVNTAYVDLGLEVETIAPPPTRASGAPRW